MANGVVEPNFFALVESRGTLWSSSLTRLDNCSYKIAVYATKAADYGIVSFFVNGKYTQVCLDGYDAKVTLCCPVVLDSLPRLMGKDNIEGCHIGNLIHRPWENAVW